MLTEIPVPYYAKDILTLSAALTKADITPYHWGPQRVLHPLLQTFSPDVFTKLTVAVKVLAALSVRVLGSKGLRMTSVHKYGLCRRSLLIPRYLGYWR